MPMPYNNHKIAYTALAIGLCVAINSSISHAAPSAKQHLKQAGFVMVKPVAAPKGLVGWAGHIGQKAGTVFISEDDQFYLLGNLYDAAGNNLSEKALDKDISQSMKNTLWQRLAQSTWILDGSPKAPRIVYAFYDPNCPYCHQFWQAARPWVNAGKVQIRHIQVGIIRPESRGQVATMLMSKDPAAVFATYNRDKAQKKLKETTTIAPHIAKKIDANRDLMEQLGFFATPAIVWLDASGALQSKQGVPRDLMAIFAP